MVIMKLLQKANERKRIIFYLPIVLIVFVAGLLIYIAYPPPVQIVRVGDGGPDLRGHDFENYVVHLRGFVEYIPNVLLSPAEFEAWVNDPANELSFGWASQYTTATSRIRLYVEDGKWYTFTRYAAEFSRRIYVNGAWLLDIGRPGKTPETDIPDTGRITFTAQGADGVIEIIQQSSNHVHRMGGAHLWWYVGTGTLLSDWVRAEQYQTAIILGSFLVLAMLFLVLFFTHRRNYASLFFAAFCFTWLMRMGVTGNRVFTVILPWMSWFTKFRIEYIAIPLSAILTLAIVDMLYKGMLHRGVLYAVYGVSGVLILLFMVLDTVIMSMMLEYMLYGYFVAAVWLLVCFVMFVYKRRRAGVEMLNLEQKVLALGLFLFVAAALADLGYLTRLFHMPPFHMAGVAVLVFALFEAVAVFIASMREFEKAKDENTTLEGLTRTKTEYLSNMSHDIRTPLTVISGNIQRTEIILENSMTDNDECIIGADDLALINRSLAKAKEESMRMVRIAESVLRMAAMQESREKMKPLNAAALFTASAEAHRGLIEKQGNTLEVTVSGGLPQIFGNADRLIQVLVNILENANRHTENGLIGVHLKHDGQYVYVTVTDTGEGIPSDIIPHIFERGITGEGSGGIGMGLAICKNIIASHGGVIEIESELGKGTTVTITVPIFTERRKATADV